MSFVLLVGGGLLVLALVGLVVAVAVVAASSRGRDDERE